MGGVIQFAGAFAVSSVTSGTCGDGEWAGLGGRWEGLGVGLGVGPGLVTLVRDSCLRSGIPYNSVRVHPNCYKNSLTYIL